MCEAGKQCILLHKMIKYVIQLLLLLLLPKSGNAVLQVKQTCGNMYFYISSLDICFHFKKKQRGR